MKLTWNSRGLEWGLILLAGALCGPVRAAGIPQLGDAPTAPSLEEVQHLRVAVPEALNNGAALSVNITNREEVRIFYNTVYNSGENAASGWTGNQATCTAGTTTPEFQDQVTVRINFFRAMAGIPAGIGLNSAWGSQDQAAALMMSANNTLNHHPPISWTCYTPAGANAASNSNLSIGSAGPDAITSYIEDFGVNNYEVGHRRWIFYPPTQRMGTGDVAENGTFNSANATWVFDEHFFDTRPATQYPFVSWPPPGYVPYPLVFARWSFGFPKADFTSATVTLSTNGVTIPVTLETVITGYGDNTLVWYPANLDPTKPYAWPPPATDTVYSVTVQNVRIDGTPTPFHYTVTVFDPSVPGADTILPLISGPSQPAVGTPTGYSFVTNPIATGYEWRQGLRVMPAVEGAENGLANVSTSTSTGYNVIVTGPVASGTHAFHLAMPAGATPTSGPSDQILTLNRIFLPSGGGQLSFKSQLGWVYSGQTAIVEVSPDDGNTWEIVYSQPGTNAQIKIENSFHARSVSLASYVGRSIMVRFRYAYTMGESYYPSVTDGYGWYLDNIAFTNTEELTGVVDSPVAAGNMFMFTPSQATNYALQVQAQVYGAYFLEWGPVKNVVGSISLTPPTANFTATPTSGTAPLLVNLTDNSTGTITNRSWNFGDGETTVTSATSLNHTYTNAGNRAITLTVSGPGGASTNQQLITISAAIPTVAPPGLAPTGGTFTNSVLVTLSCATDGATIYYTTNGTAPTTSSLVYATSFTLSNSATVQAEAVASGFADSAVASASFTILKTPVVPVPTFTPTNGVFGDSVKVTVKCSLAKALIRYTLDGSEPTTNSAQYKSPMTVTNSVLKARAYKTGYLDSPTGTANFTITIPVITTPLRLPDATASNRYSQTLEVSGGQPKYKWTLVASPLPEGLKFSSAGVISGQPTKRTTAPVQLKVKVTDAKKGTDQRTFTLQVN